MSESKSPFPIGDDHRLALLEDLQEQLHRLHSHWRIYVAFFGDRAFVDAVQRQAPFTFGIIQEVLRQATVLGIQQLLAPYKSRGQISASVQTLILQMAPEHAALALELQSTLDALRDDCANLKAWRDRHIAHRDYAVAMEIELLGEIKIRTIRRALEDLSRILTRFAEAYEYQLTFDFHPDTDAELFDADVVIARFLGQP